MIDSIEKNLMKGIKLLTTISDDKYSDNSVAPYHSSIGCHIRHVLDVFSCILLSNENGKVDLTNRKRNELVELKTELGINYFNTILNLIKSLTEKDLSKKITVTDDLGMGKLSAEYTLGAALMQAQSHAIHHYASIGYIIYQLDLELPDSDFGFNPTTPKKVIKTYVKNNF